jgi:hypothetical protein
MTWAYVPEDAVEYDTAMPDDYAPYDPQEHWHDDGTMHSHEDGMEPHTHDPA